MLVEFPSLAHPEEYLFKYDDDQYYRSSILSSEMVYSSLKTNSSATKTLDVSVCDDYLASLSVAIKTNQDLARKIRWKFDNIPSAETIEFFANIFYKVSDEYKKPRYYSYELKKVSSVKSKQHDRRFERIESWMDGSPKAVFKFFERHNAMHNGLSKYNVATAIHDWFYASHDKKHRYMSMPYAPIFLEWTTDEDKVSAIRYAMEALKYTLASIAEQAKADSALHCFKQYAVQFKLES